MMRFLFTATPLKLMVQSLWRDEAFSYLLAHRPVGQIFALTARDFNPPFYYLLLHYWMRWFGSSEISMRTLSLICFWGVILVAYLFLRRILKIKPKPAAFYLLLFVCNPLLQYYAFEARMYSLLAFLASLSCYAFLRRRRLLYLTATVLGLYTHYFMVLVLLVQLVARLTLRLRRVTVPAADLFLAVGGFVPWLIFMLSVGQTQLGAGFWIDKPQLSLILNLPAIIYTGYGFDFPFYRGIFFFTAALIAGLIWLSRRSRLNRNLKWFLGLWAFLPGLITLLVSFYKPVFLPRYLIFSSVGLILLYVALIKNQPRVTQFLVTLALLVATGYYGQLQLKYHTKTDLRAVIKEISGIAQPSDLLYVTDPLDFHVAQYYFDANRAMIFGKTYDELPQYIGKILIDPRQIALDFPTYPVKAFVLQPDLRYDIVSQY
ncbi:glycosyltransferase family 39 protein [Patescibacteria group bacterium]|nr:glycosyltransferase family 39 protein [Patescibacteria group bacterium]MCL5091662.1 glycosyltransferase family 39 protein [Patescibacteria group bacterium]